VEKRDKKHLLNHILENKSIETALVFTRTKHGADRVVKDLNKEGITAEAIHGNKSQNARQRALSNFKTRKTRVLVATDIAARGIDIDELTHVFNYELPNIPETYVHRIGRTGRAGADGKAISFCEREERPYLKDIQKLIGKTIPVIDEHPFVNATPVPTSSEVYAQRPKSASNGNSAPFKKKWNNNGRSNNSGNRSSDRPQRDSSQSTAMPSRFSRY
jgi:ATP-dependent RNA helicase RhlE